MGLALVTGVPASGQISGSVVDAQGRPVSGVTITAERDGEAVTTTGGDDGYFELPLDPPAEFEARKRGFGAARIKVAEGEHEVEIQLPLAPYADELVVAARQDTLGVPRTASLSTVVPEERAGSVPSVTDLVADLPAVSQSGQGGLLQVFSIRGMSRHRVLTLVDGVRIVSERRAGSSTSFVDPRLVDGVEVLRGPTSSRFGSGALGGVVNLVPKTWQQARVGAGWNSDGDAAWGKIGWGDGETSLAASYRRSGDGETADGLRLFSRYRHASISAARRWGNDERAYRLRLLGSRGEDIGKVSTDFPERETFYDEDHWIGRFVASGARHTLSVSAHPSRVETDVFTGPILNRVVNRARDWSLSWNRTTETRPGILLFGTDVFGRSGVRATEIEGPVTTTTLDGRQLESSGFATWERPTERVTFAAGARWTLLEQGQRGLDSESESAASAFLGLAVDLDGGWDARLHTGSGWRFASLSERFFEGTTGRGQVIGNPDLDPERSWGAEAGLRWTGERAYTEAAAHYTRVDDYIERVDAGDQRTFVNLDSGTISGFELAGSRSIDPSWSLDWGGHSLDGEADSGAPLADIPPDRIWLGATWRQAGWVARGRLEQRLSKNDPASGELPLESATVVSLRLENELRWGVVGFTIDNLLDETYRTAADDKLPPASGRSLGFSWRWPPSPAPAR